VGLHTKVSEDFLKYSGNVSEEVFDVGNGYEQENNT